MSVTAERLMVEVQADVRQALAKLDQVEKKAATSSGRMSKMARSMGLAFGASTIVSGITKTIGLAMNFDATMRQVGVQTDQTGKSLSKLSDLALKMGKDTVFSASDASGAMLELAKGGLNAAQIRAGALEQTLTLAAAGGLDLANAAGYITQGMNTYGLKAKQAAQVTTALAGGANASTASVESLGTALSQVGPGAVNAGMSIQETVAALAAFDNAGIKGSDAGTSLKTMLSNLVPATKGAEDAMRQYGLEFVKRNGDFKSMSQVAQELKEGLGDLSQAERVQAMRTIFGSDATRAATVLMKEGAKGVRDYVKAANDQKKTQEMANSAMEGAKGAWENLKGSVETAAIQLGTKLLPAFTKAATKGADFVDQVMGWGPEIEDSFGWTIDAAKGVVSAFEPLVDLAKTLASAWSGLPDGMKSFATQVGLAALVVPRLTTAVTSAATAVVSRVTAMKASLVTLRTEFATTATTAGRLQLAASKMGGAFQMAAGIGGMVALQQGAERSNRSLTVLGGTLTGAAMGAAVGSVIPGLGTAIGGVAGAAVGMTTSIWKSAGQVEHLATASDRARGPVLNLKDTLDQVTGAATRATKANILMGAEQSGILGITHRLGVANRDVIGAVLGNKGSVERLTGAYRKHFDTLSGPEQVDFNTWLGRNTTALRNARGEIVRTNRDLTSWKQALKGLPPKVQTKVKAIGVDITQAQLRKLKKQYDLTDKQVETIVRAVGTETAVKKVKGVWKVMRDGEKLDPGTDKWAAAFLSDVGRASKGAQDFSGDLLGLAKQRPTPKVDLAGVPKVRGDVGGLENLLAGLGRKRANPSAFLNDQASGAIAGVAGRLAGLNGKTATVTTIMRTIHETGTRLLGALPHIATGGRVIGPGTGTSDSIPAMLSNGEYVLDAETTKRALPLIKMLHRSKGRAFGYAQGGQAGSAPGAPSAPKLTDAQEKAQAAAKARKQAAKEFLKGMVRGIREGLKETHKTFRQLDRTIQKNMSGKAEAAWMKRSNRVEHRLTRLWERQEKVQKRLADAQEKVANLRQAKSGFMGSVRDGIASQATVLNAGNSATAIGQSLQVQVAKVRKFAGMLQKLRKRGYSDAIVKQVAAAGVEGGYNAAVALLQGTKEQAAQISADFATITKTAGDTAKQLGAQMYDSGIHAAEGLVAGLKKRRKEVQQTIMDMAMAMQKALKKALGIKSPSRVFAKLGSYTAQGMVKGLLGEEASVGKAATRLGKAATYGSTKGLTTASLQGGQRAGSSVVFHFTTHNPQAEPQSLTTNKALAKVATLGLV